MGGEVDTRAVREEVIERGTAAIALQPIDAAEPAIVEHDDVQLLVQHHRSRDLGIHHQIGAIADQDPDFALGHGQLDPEPAGDLIPHTGIAVFDVVGAGLSAAPQFVQFAGQSAGSANDDILWGSRAVHRAEHLRVARQRGVRGRRCLRHRCVPFGSQVPRLSGPVDGRSPRDECTF